MTTVAVLSGGKERQPQEAQENGAEEIGSEPASGMNRAALFQLADELTGLSLPLTSPGSPAPAAKPVSLKSIVRRALRGLARGSLTPAYGVVPGADGVLIDQPLDTSWAHERPSHAKVLHVSHQYWHGIRAAAGYLPGSKAAIVEDRRLTLTEVNRLAELIERRKLETVMFHGWSANMTLIATALRRLFGKRLRLVAVWHGNSAQFINPFEMECVHVLIQLRQKRVLDALTSVKPDLYLLDPSFERDVLLNVGPRVTVPAPRPYRFESALIPVPLDWRKNLHTNLFAVAAAGYKRAIVTAGLTKEQFPFKLRCKLEHLDRPPRDVLFSVLTHVDLVMNVTLSECQPMTTLEALAHRVPSLTGPLSLGDLDRHPYQQLAQVERVDTLGPVTRAIEKFRSIESNELRAMMADYETTLMKEAWRRLERICQ